MVNIVYENNKESRFKRLIKVYKNNTYNYLEFGFEGKYIHTKFETLSEEELEDISEDYENDDLFSI